MKDTLFILFQYLVPQHLLSRLIGKLASTEIVWLKNFLIEKFVEHFNVNMTEALNPDTKSYKSFNEFFVRPLQADARTLSTDKTTIVCPADGAISQLGIISSGRVFQAKGKSFSTIELLGGDKELASQFDEGHFATVYLSPKDYHRVHMPISGTLQQMVHVPGQLFSVNEVTAENVPRLFARNERVVSIFETELGPVAVVLVGAMIVASIETVWAGQIAPAGQCVATTHYGSNSVPSLQAGEEMGRFKLGSTVVMLFPKNTVEWDESLKAGSPVQMGSAFGKKA